MASSVTILGGVVTFTCQSGTVAVAQRAVTTAQPDVAVSYRFVVARRPVTLRVGSTAGGQEIVTDAVFEPGWHLVTFTPGHASYHLQFTLSEVGVATLSGFERVPPGVLELVTPWPTADLPLLRTEQQNNVVWVARAGSEPHVIERRGATSWSVRPWRPANGPFDPLVIDGPTLAPSGRVGAVTVTASRPVFDARDVNRLVRISHAGQYEIADLATVDAVTDAIRVSGVEQGRLFFYSVAGGFTGTVALERSVGNELSFTTVQSFTGPVSGSLNDEFTNQVIFYRLRMTSHVSGTATVTLTYSGGVTDGVGRIVEVVADNEVRVDVLEPFGKAEASGLWAFGSWSDRTTHPAAVALLDGRLWWASRNQYWASRVEDYADMDVGTEADAPLARSLPGRMTDTHWLVAGPALVAGTSAAEYVIGATTFEEIVTPTNVRARAQTTRGAANVQGLHVDDGVLYIARALNRLYRFSMAENVTVDLTRLHRQMSGMSGFRQIAFQMEPEPRVWCVRHDGQVGVLVMDLAEQVLAWCRLKVDGRVLSVSILPGTPEDVVHLAVSRTVQDRAVTFIEQVALERWDTVAEAWRLDAALQVTGATSRTVSGLGHLEGREVYAWADGRQSGPHVVSGGAVTISHSASRIIVGLRREGRYKSARLAWSGQGSSLTGNKQVSRIGLVLHDTPGGQLKMGRAFDAPDMTRLPDRKAAGAFDAPLDLWNEDYDYPVQGATLRDPRIHIVMDGAGPATVLGYVPVIDLNE